MSTGAEKAFGKIRYLFTIKALIKPGIGGNFPDQINNNHKPETTNQPANITFDGKTLKSPLKIGNKMLAPAGSIQSSSY